MERDWQQMDCQHQRDCNFNPLSRMERDVVSNSCRGCNCLFQSTLSHGERPCVITFPFGHIIFQSTLSHGERLISKWHFAITVKFQSTLSHGERQISHFLNPQHRDFNPLSRMERDSTVSVSEISQQLISIHSLAWRETGTT